MGDFDRKDFIVIEDFFAVNPQLDEAEEGSIIRECDTNPADVTDAATGLNTTLPTHPANDSGEPKHILDANEIKTYFQKHGWYYDDLLRLDPQKVGLHFAVDADTLFAQYIVKHLSYAKLSEVVEPKGFPIADGTTLLRAIDEPPEGMTHLQSNLVHYLDYLDQMPSVWEQTAEGFRLTAEGSAVAIEKVGQAPVYAAFHRKKPPIVFISLDINELFLGLLDPRSEDPDLSLKISHAFEQASVQYDMSYQEITEDGFDAAPMAEGKGVFIRPEDLAKWLNVFRGAMALDLTRAKRTEPEQAVFSSWTLTDQKGLEDYLSAGRVFLDDTNRLRTDDEILSFFDTQGEVVSQDELDRWDLNSFLGKFGYSIEVFASTPIPVRILERAVSEQDVYQGADYGGVIRIGPDMNRVANSVVVDCEPINAEQAVQLISRAKDKLLSVPKDLLPFLARQGFFSAYIRENHPWLAVVVDQMGDQAFDLGVGEYIKATQRLMCGNFLRALPYQGMSKHDLMLLALAKSKNPKAALAYELLQTELTEDSGQLSLLLARIPCFKDTVGQYRGFSGGMEVTVFEGFEPLSNAWFALDEGVLTQLAQRLAEIDDEEFLENVRGLVREPDLMQQQDILNRYAYPQTMTYEPTQQALPQITVTTTDTSCRETAFSLKQLLRYLKLKTTEEKVRRLDPALSGQVQLRDVISLNLTNAEREDLKRALAKISRHMDLKDWNLDPLPANPAVEDDYVQPLHADPVYQLELLPAKALQCLLYNSVETVGSEDVTPEALWKALYFKDEGLALQTFDEIISYLEKKQKTPTLRRMEFGARAGMIGYGLDGCLISRNPQSQDILQRHQDFLLGFVTEAYDASTYTQLYRRRTELLMSRLGRVDVQQVLARSFHQEVPAFFTLSLQDQLGSVLVLDALLLEVTQRFGVSLSVQDLEKILTETYGQSESWVCNFLALSQDPKSSGRTALPNARAGVEGLLQRLVQSSQATNADSQIVYHGNPCLDFADAIWTIMVRQGLTDQTDLVVQYFNTVLSVMLTQEEDPRVLIPAVKFVTENNITEGIEDLPSLYFAAALLNLPWGWENLTKEQLLDVTTQPPVLQLPEGWLRLFHSNVDRVAFFTEIESRFGEFSIERGIISKEMREAFVLAHLRANKALPELSESDFQSLEQRLDEAQRTGIGLSDVAFHID